MDDLVVVDERIDRLGTGARDVDPDPSPVPRLGEPLLDARPMLTPVGALPDAGPGEVGVGPRERRLVAGIVE